jgi:hypothetical protein
MLLVRRTESALVIFSVSRHFRIASWHLKPLHILTPLLGFQFPKAETFWLSRL